MASQTARCDVDDLRYKMLRVKKGDVDSGQLPPCKFKKMPLCLMLCGLIIKNKYGKYVMNQKRTPTAKRDMDG